MWSASCPSDLLPGMWHWILGVAHLVWSVPVEGSVLARGGTHRGAVEVNVTRTQLGSRPAARRGGRALPPAISAPISTASRLVACI